MNNDPAVQTLARLFAEHPVWVAAFACIAEGAESDLYFSHLPAAAWHLVKCAGRVFLEPDVSANPDFVFRFTPAAVAKLALVSGRADQVAVTLFDLMTSSDAEQTVEFRILAPFRTLVGHGHLHLLLTSGPAVFVYGATHGIRTLGQLRTLVKRLSAVQPFPWEKPAAAGRPA